MKHSLKLIATRALSIGVLTLVATQADAGGDLGDLGSFAKWSKIEIEMTGPDSNGLSDSPNPFEITIDVTFSSPSGGSWVVPAFYDGDGNGGLNGDVWKVRFAAPETGTWTFSSDSSDSILDNYTGSFTVTPAPSNAPQFEKVGLLRYAGGHYLKFADGGYWIKGGADEPEDFLAPGVMGDWDDKKNGVSYLASKGVNSMYIMLHNVDGDGDNVWPWVSPSDTDHFDVDKLRDWEDLFDHIQGEGLVLHLVWEDDSAWTGFNRDLYYREMIARFGHYNAIIWNISEEFNENYSSSQVKSFAQKITDLDAYGHPITVHHAGSLSTWGPFVADDRFDLTSFQTSRSRQNDEAIDWREDTTSAGRPIPISFDETGRIETGDRDIARYIVWSIFMGGGMFEMFTMPMDAFQDFEDHWNDMRHARLFVASMPFWEMEPDNSLIIDGSGDHYCFAKPGEVYAVYLEDGGQASLDLSGESGTFELTWLNPRTGATTDGGLISAGGVRSLGSPPYSGDVAVKVISTSQVPQYTLSVSSLGSGTGTVTSTPEGIDCGSDCTQQFQDGTPVSLNATPDSGSTFGGWGGHPDCADGQITMDRDLGCTATFDDAAGNEVPVAHDLIVPTIEGVPIGFILTYTDGDGPGPYTYTVLDTPDFGDLTGTAPNLTYVPDAGFTGSDQMNWIVNDGLDDSNVATADFQVQQNQPPVANDFSISVSAGSSVGFSLATHVSDPDGPGPLTFSIVGQPAHGDLDGSDNDWTYTPDDGFAGQDEFTWQVHDGLDLSNLATGTIFVDQSLFEDQFDRSDSGNLGNGWVEIESQSETRIESGRAVFAADDDSYRPMIIHSLAASSPGGLTWTFDMDFERDGSESSYSFWMQLGDSAQMDNSQPTEDGVAINLIWGGPDAGLDSHEGLGVVLGGQVTQIATVSGPHTVEVQIDLNSQVYSVTVAGQTVSDIPLSGISTIDTVRYFAHLLNSSNFASTALDNVYIEAQPTDMVFASDFESGNLSDWSFFVN